MSSFINWKQGRIAPLGLVATFLVVLGACGEGTSSHQDDRSPAVIVPAGDVRDPIPVIADSVFVPMLVKGYWVIDAFIMTGDSTAQDRNRGRWFRFQPDGTFKSGRYGETSTRGSWFWENRNQTITIDADRDEEDSEYRLRKVPSDNILFFVGTPTYDQTNVQGKMVHFNQLPDAKSF